MRSTHTKYVSSLVSYPNEDLSTEKKGSWNIINKIDSEWL